MNMIEVRYLILARVGMAEMKAVMQLAVERKVLV